jgi:hypothetical protein
VADIKLKTLARVGRALKAKNILFGVGGSAMLYRNGLAADFNDIDLVVAIKDAYRADEVLSGLGRRGEERSAGVFETDVFRSYEADGVGIDMMAGLAIRHDEGVYHYDFRESSVCDTWPVYGEMLPFCAPEDWCVLYHLMPGKENKAERIKAHFESYGTGHPDMLARMLAGGAPVKTVQWLHTVLPGNISPEE